MTFYVIWGKARQNRKEFVRRLPADSRLISYNTPRRGRHGSLFFVDSTASRETIEAAYSSTNKWAVASDEVAKAIVGMWQDLDFRWDDPSVHDINVTRHVARRGHQPGENP